MAFLKVFLVWILVTGIFPKFFYYDARKGFRVEGVWDMFVFERKTNIDLKVAKNTTFETAVVNEKYSII